MKQLGRLLVLICVLALMGLSVGCDGGNAGGWGNWQTEPNYDQNHSPDLTPADCGTCHGENAGAIPPRTYPHGHQRCIKCHRNELNHTSGFTNASCSTCHSIACGTCHFGR